MRLFPSRSGQEGEDFALLFGCPLFTVHDIHQPHAGSLGALLHGIVEHAAQVRAVGVSPDVAVQDMGKLVKDRQLLVERREFGVVEDVGHVSDHGCEAADLVMAHFVRDGADHDFEAACCCDGFAKGFEGELSRPVEGVELIAIRGAASGTDDGVAPMPQPGEQGAVGSERPWRVGGNGE